MRLAIKDVSKATSDTSKQERMDALLTKMKVIYAIDVFLYLVVVVAVIKALVTGETFFGSDHGVIMRLLLFTLGMGLGDIHFDIMMMTLLANTVVYVPTARYLDTLAQANSSSSFLQEGFYDPGDDFYVDIDDWGYNYNDDGDMGGIPGTGEWCEVFYNDRSECDAPCVAHSSSLIYLSKFTNYVGLAMDAVLCFHCMKNYRDIYPSILSTVMMVMIIGVEDSIKFDTKKDTAIFFLVLSIVGIIVICRYCYAGCNIGEACCKGGGQKFHLTCIGIGMYLIGVIPYCIAIQNSTKACKVVDDWIGHRLASLNDALSKYDRGRNSKLGAIVHVEEGGESTTDYVFKNSKIINKYYIETTLGPVNGKFGAMFNQTSAPPKIIEIREGSVLKDLNQAGDNLELSGGYIKYANIGKDAEDFFDCDRLTFANFTNKKDKCEWPITVKIITKMPVGDALAKYRVIEEKIEEKEEERDNSNSNSNSNNESSLFQSQQEQGAISARP
ncbi:hypothetical protein ScalyP_jg293, partial [Parmales sp. scaly parma]